MMDAILEAIQHLWGKPWFHEVLIFLFFACIFLGYKISRTEKYLRWRVKRNPESFQAHLNLAEYLSEFEDSYEEAEIEFQKAIAIQPKNRDTLYDLYSVQNKAGKTESAEKTILELIQLFPNDSTVCVWAGMHYTDRDNFRAEEFYTKANSLAPNSLFVKESIGYFLQKQKRIEEAINVFLEAFKLNPNSVYSLRWIVTLLGNSERYKEAEEYARKLISISFNNGQDYYVLGLTLFYLNKYAESVAVLRKAYKLNPMDINIQITLGEALSEVGKRSEAEERFLSAIKLDPTNQPAYRKYGNYLEEENRFEEARKSYEKAIEINKDDIGSNYSLGHILFTKFNQAEEAEIFINKSIELNSGFGLPYITLGNIYTKLKQFSKAEMAFKKALELDAKDDYAQSSLSKLLIKLDRVEEAINILLEMKNNHPDEYFVYIELASAYKAIGKHKEMLDLLETSRLLIKQNSKNELYDLACVESIAGNIDLAFDYLRKSKEENQLNLEWAWEDTDLDWIRDDSRFVEIVGEKPQEKLPN